MRRIGLVFPLIVCLLLVSLVTWGQPADRMRQVAVLLHDTGPEGGGASSFEGALRERGWIMGHNITVEIGTREEGRSDWGTWQPSLRTFDRTSSSRTRTKRSRLSKQPRERFRSS